MLSNESQMRLEAYFIHNLQSTCAVPKLLRDISILFPYNQALMHFATLLQTYWCRCWSCRAPSSSWSTAAGPSPVPPAWARTWARFNVI